MNARVYSFYAINTLYALFLQTFGYSEMMLQFSSHFQIDPGAAHKSSSFSINYSQTRFSRHL